MSLSSKSTPLALSAWQSYMSHTILASQSHRGNTSTCNCEAEITILVFPGVKNMPQSTKIALDGTISIMGTKCILGEERHIHPRQQESQPLPKTHPYTPPLSDFVSAGLAPCTSSITRSPKNINNFAISSQLYATVWQPQQPLLAAPSSCK